MAKGTASARALNFFILYNPEFPQRTGGDARRSTGPKLFKDGAMNLYLKKVGFFLTLLFLLCSAAAIGTNERRSRSRLVGHLS